MKRKTIDAWHEARMTTVQIVIPAFIAAFAVDGRYPGLKYKIRDSVKEKKEYVSNKVNEFIKKES